jgi:two-component system, LuxR family, response regulator FixJ
VKLLPAVFVIDDYLAIQDALKGLLSAWGIRVHSFLSAEAFLESYSDEWTGCLLVDIRMPGMSGFDLLKELRSRGSSLPAILMTGHGVEGLEQEAIGASAVNILEKPFQVEQLRDFLVRQCRELFGGAKAAGDA